VRLESFYKEALLRSVNSYSVNRNLDKNNSLNIYFEVPVEGQLVELNFETLPMNTYYYTVNNSSSEPLSISQVVLGELSVVLNEVDITNCLVQECNETSCHGGSSGITKFEGSMNTLKMYLNLTKISAKPECNIVLKNNQTNRITFNEVSDNPLEFKGARLNAQVLVYNRTYKVEDILNLFN